MSVIPTPQASLRPAAIPLSEPPIRHLLVEEYQRMYEAGILVEEGLELLNGVIYYKGGRRLRPIGLEDYHRMLEIGILNEGDAIELIDGVMRFKMTKGTRHESTVDKIARRLSRILPDMMVRVQSAVSFLAHEPEPDIVVAVGPEGRYDDHHPRPHEIALIVEVADSSINFDRGLKKAGYANAGVIEYWVVSIPDRVVDVYTDPTGPEARPLYRVMHQSGLDDSIAVRIEGREIGRIEVREIFPRD